MKKTYLLLTMLFISVMLVSCSKKEKLILYIPNDYIDKTLVKKFEKKENVKVKMLTFDSNEVALGQIKSNNYDLIVPSDYAIEELANEGYLLKINYKEILGKDFLFTKQLKDFLDTLKEEGFDFLEYSVPYFYGSFGVLYNKNTITDNLVKEEGFNIISNKQFETIIYDSARDAFMAAMLVNDILIHEYNSLDELDANILKAENFLKNAKGKTTSILSDEILTDMLRGTRYDAVMTYSGDAAYIMSENNNYKYFMPNNTNLWVDGFVIPKNTNNKDLAIKFIQFISSYENMYANSLEIGYSAIKEDVMKDLLKDEYNLNHIKYAYEPKLENFQTYRYDKVLKDKIDEAWRRVKAYK